MLHPSGLLCSWLLFIIRPWFQQGAPWRLLPLHTAKGLANDHLISGLIVRGFSPTRTGVPHSLSVCCRVYNGEFTIYYNRQRLADGPQSYLSCLLFIVSCEEMKASLGALAPFFFLGGYSLILSRSSFFFPPSFVCSGIF